ncbi:MAG: OmpA family protein, partial [Bacteroidota bacterium]
MKVFLLIFVFSLTTIPNLWAQSSPDSIHLAWSDEIYFDFAQHQLRPGTDSLLSKVFALYAQKTVHRIELTAHTDAIGSNDSNWRLAEARGASVLNFLTQGSVPDSLLQRVLVGL